jgi:dTDP-4-dehydrorhamnose 3,5-epimerase
MIFQETKIAGVFEIRVEQHTDDRGFFARTWCQKEFEDHGLNSRLVQCNLSGNIRKGTLRGMHYQAMPYAEAKLIRCTAGAVYDVALDLRENSPTFLQWTATILRAKDHNMLFVPEGCAHGFLTLEDNCEVYYQMSEVYHAESGRGVRWNDPAFKIEWPGKVEAMAERDRSYPDFKRA